MINKTRSLIIKSFVVITLLLNVNLAYADQSQQVYGYIESLANKVITIVKGKSITQQAKTDEIFVLLQDNFDLDWMAKFVIAQNYRQLSSSQKLQYKAIYTQFFLYSYLPNLMKYTDESFKILRVIESGSDSFTVETQIIRPGGHPPISINYQVRFKDSGQYQVIDVVVEGVSAIMSQRSEFSSIIQQLGVDGFISQLDSKSKMLASEK